MRHDGAEPLTTRGPLPGLIVIVQFPAPSSAAWGYENRTVAVRVPGGEHELQRGDIVRYPAGPEGAHQIANRSDTVARVLLFSKVAVPAVSVYPDSDTIGVWPDDDTEYYFKRNTAVPRDVG